MPIHVYVDIDDVLTDTTRALARLAAERFGKRVAFEEMYVFDLAESLGLAPDEYERFMHAAHETTFLMGLVAVEGAVPALADWYAAGVEISVVTGRPPESREPTERWLAREDVPHHRLELVDKYGRYGDRTALDRTALRSRGYEVVIEDSAEMAGYLAEHGADVLLVDKPWNRRMHGTPPGVLRVRGWDEIRTWMETRIRRAG